uniref:Glyoxysomal processing protease, glyoxysomal n=1 Tax=Oryza glumipatula TaxID=40148 RepID=A0A0E0A165_9ORYZ
MAPREVAAAACGFSAMARIVGPDPKAVKMRRHAFHLHQSGSTTLSASALLLPPGSLAEPPPLLDRICAAHGQAGGVALTSASLVEPFLVEEQRNSPSQELQPRLVPEAHLDVLVEHEESRTIGGGKTGAPQWLSARLLAIVDVQASADSVLSLLQHEGSLIRSSSWDVCWSLADVNQKQVDNDARYSLESNRKNAYAESTEPPMLAKSATRIAILGVSNLNSSNTRCINVSLMQQRGDSLLIMGSPFGILSPVHFFNSISVGVVANCLPPGTARSSLLMADVHCLPGAPVFDKNSCLVGMLMKPLRQRGSSTEVQLVITWDAICNAWNSDKLERIGHPPIVLVTVGETSWASGIILNKNGLIITNAHLLEPWRFGRTSSLGLQNKIASFSEHTCGGENNLLQPQQCKVSNEDAVKHELSLFNFGLKKDRAISVRLDHGERKTWCNASVVFISKGPLDVALLQMEKTPIELCAIRPEFVCPTAGSSVYVVGHGLLGPRSGLSSSLSSGVVSKIVKIPSTQHSQLSSVVEVNNMDIPVMLQTTAAVHPGASGGVLLDSLGRMVGLITSNAKHGGGSTIPHLNFSIPCKSLEMVFKYSAKGDFKILEQLDKPNEVLSSVWALAPTSSPFFSTSPENGRGGKVLEFSKFLADKQEGLKSIKDIEAFLRDRIPSKI